MSKRSAAARKVFLSTGDEVDFWIFGMDEERNEHELRASCPCYRRMGLSISLAR